MIKLSGLNPESGTKVELINPSGVVIPKFTEIPAKGISISNLKDGLYFVRVTQSFGTCSTHTVIIKI